MLKTKQKRRQEDIETQKKRMAAAEKILAQDISEQRKRAEALAQTKVNELVRDLAAGLMMLERQEQSRARHGQSSPGPSG